MGERIRYIVGHDHNALFLYRICDDDGAEWCREPQLAQLYDTESDAMAVITNEFNGKGYVLPYIGQMR